MKYTPNSPAVVEDMLRSAGFSSLDELFKDIPEAIKLKRKLNLGPGRGEIELTRELKGLAAKNLTTEDYPCFLGAGAYDHYIPAAIDQLLLRSEFYTAYTPYQAEISQGILQSIFEYQSMICLLTGMEVANASMYDGGSALAEACVL
ncbi:MAG: glycine dehydrogenase, partial [Syntrophomonadaceae bacterium]